MNQPTSGSPSAGSRCRWRRGSNVQTAHSRVLRVCSLRRGERIGAPAPSRGSRRRNASLVAAATAARGATASTAAPLRIDCYKQTFAPEQPWMEQGSLHAALHGLPQVRTLGDPAATPRSDGSSTVKLHSVSRCSRNFEGLFFIGPPVGPLSRRSASGHYTEEYMKRASWRLGQEVARRRPLASGEAGLLPVWPCLRRFSRRGR